VVFVEVLLDGPAEDDSDGAQLGFGCLVQPGMDVCWHVEDDALHGLILSFVAYACEDDEHDAC
jgi:hypothetical protein